MVYLSSILADLRFYWEYPPPPPTPTPSAHVSDADISVNLKRNVLSIYTCMEVAPRKINVKLIRHI